MDILKMYDRHRKVYCDVYEVDFNLMQAVTFSSDNMAKTNGGSCWCKVPMKHLIPVEYACDYIESGYISKTKKNHYKGKLRLVSAVWATTDGELFNNSDEAVKHQILIEGDTITEEELHPTANKEETNEEETAVC